MSHAGIRRSLSHRLSKQQSPQSQRFAKASTFSPGSRNILDWEYQAMEEMHLPVANAASDNEAETVSCGQSS
ncbi:hypothetical protein LPJ56_004692, partial [Coemansia sp. RSA 2599]